MSVIRARALLEETYYRADNDYESWKLPIYLELSRVASHVSDAMHRCKCLIAPRSPRDPLLSSTKQFVSRR